MKIIAISDQHGQLLDIPACDLLIVAGDNVPDVPYRQPFPRGSDEQMDAQDRFFRTVFLPWRARQPAAECLITWGNHDYFAERLHVRQGPRIRFDEHTAAIVDDLVTIDGLKIWLAPWSRRFNRWAWMLDDEDRLAAQYARIPDDVDILVSHQPPHGCGDSYLDLKTGLMAHQGSTALLATIERIQPIAVICGHLHGGHGAYRVGGTMVHNVSVVNEQYALAYPPTTIMICTDYRPDHNGECLNCDEPADAHPESPMIPPT